MAANLSNCSTDSDCASNYCLFSTCTQRNTDLDDALAQLNDDTEDAVKGWVIALIIIAVLILIGIIACIVCCICGAAWCCKKAMEKDSNEGGEREVTKVQMAAIDNEQ